MMKRNAAARVSLSIGLAALLTIATNTTGFAQGEAPEPPAPETPSAPDPGDTKPDNVTSPDPSAVPNDTPVEGDGTASETGNSPVSNSVDSAGAIDTAKPWNEGLTEADIAAATPFFKRGNDFFKRSMYAKALVEYRQAIKHRDHPAIRFNMAVCLMNSRQEIEAHQQLTLAMRYGEAPLGPRLFQDGKTYLNLLMGQLAKIRIVTDEEGAQISLDGEELFIGPGEATRLVKPVSHLIVANKSVMRTVTQEVTPAAGGVETLITLSMVPLADSIVMTRRWKKWKPLAVTGGGAGVAALGIPFYMFALSNAKDYDDQTADICPSTEGCSDAGTPLPAAVKDLRSRAQTQEIVAFSLFAVGGAAMATGALMLYMNRERPEHLRESDPVPSTTLSVQPLLTPTTTGFTAGLNGSF